MTDAQAAQVFQYRVHVRFNFTVRNYDNNAAFTLSFLLGASRNSLIANATWGWN